jgi:predicted RNA binding protein YcfA (HicA-like mRNA interferase family)
MSRVPSVKPRELVNALKRRGFEEHHQKGSHLYLRHPETRHSVSVPIHSSDLPRGTLFAILKQAGLTADELLLLL